MANQEQRKDGMPGRQGHPPGPDARGKDDQADGAGRIGLLNGPSDPGRKQ